MIIIKIIIIIKKIVVTKGRNLAPEFAKSNEQMILLVWHVTCVATCIVCQVFLKKRNVLSTALLICVRRVVWSAEIHGLHRPIDVRVPVRAVVLGVPVIKAAATIVVRP